ncbi:MAG: urease accessory protein UreD [Nocardiopsaceae bacterium]|jgi:urease accessory protein|nr:urease accessory protein UreD [Nocardiopsaceae bacterium]
MQFARSGDRSVLAHLRRQAPLLAQQALYWDEHLPGMPCVYVITTSGCVLQGDRHSVSISVRRGAMAHVTTQAATKVHEMDAGFAVQSVHLDLDSHAYLELLPGPVIPHRHSRFVASTTAAVAPTATLLIAELVAPGRKYHGDGEVFEYDLYSSALTVQRPDGQLLCAEKLVCEPWRYPVRLAGVMGEFDVLANVALIAPTRLAEAVLKNVSAEIDAGAGYMAGAGHLPNDAGLFYKVLGKETEQVRAKVRDFWWTVRSEALGTAIPEPRPWQ